MDRTTHNYSYRLLVTLFVIFFLNYAQAFPEKHLIQPKNPLSDVISSINNWRMSEELQLVIKDLQNNNRDRAKLRLGKYLANHKNEPHALNIAGLILLEEGKYEASTESFKRLLKQGIKTAETFALAGVSSYMFGDQNEAIKLLKKSISIDQSQILALRYLALIESSRGNYEAAIPLYKKIINSSSFKNKPLSKVHINLADALTKTGRSDEAIKLIKAPTKNNKLALERSIILASAHAKKGQLTKGISILKDTLNEKNGFLIISEQIQLYRQYGHLGDALKLNNSLIKHYPKALANLYYQKGSILAQKKEYSKAAATTLQALKFATEKELSKIQLTAARYYSLAGDSAKAEGTLRSALNNDSENIELKYQLAELVSKTKNIKEAEQILDSILSTNETYYKAHYLKGVFAWHRKQIAVALSHFNQSVNANPNFIDGWIALSQVEHSRSNDEKMLSTLESGLKHNPQSPVLRYQLAGHAFSMGNTSKVLKLLKKFPPNSPIYGDAQSLYILSLIEKGEQPNNISNIINSAKKTSSDNLYLQDAEGYFLARYGNTSKAITLLTKAAKNVKDDPLIYLHLSEALLTDGRKEQAKTNLLKATSLGLHNSIEKKLAKRIQEKL